MQAFASPPSMNKYHVLMQRKERLRLRQLRQQLVPEDYLLKQGALHKAVAAVLRQPSHREQAIQAFIEIFVPLLRQRPFPDWIDLLDEVLEVAEERNALQHIAELTVLRCRYLHDLYLIDPLMAYINKQISREAITTNRLVHTDLLIFLGAAHKIRSEFQTAESYLQQGIEVLGNVDSPQAHDRYGRLLNVCGTIAMSQKDWEKGRLLCEEAAESLKKSSNEFYYHRARKNLAFSLIRQNKFDLVFSMFESAIHFYRENNNKYEESVSLIELAIAHNAQGLTHEAEKTLLSIDYHYLYQIPPTTALAHYHNNLGYYYFVQEMYELAQPHLLASIEVYKKLGKPYEVHLASTKSQLGQLYKRVDDISEAESVFKQALLILSEYISAGSERARQVRDEIKDEAPYLFG